MIEEVQRGHTHQINGDMDNSVLPELEAKPNGTFATWVPIMNGCNKFCTYCIVLTSVVEKLVVLEAIAKGR